MPENLVGLVRDMRRSSEAKQREELEATGCGRIWSWEDRTKLVRYLRKRDTVVMTEAHCLGPTRDSVEALLSAILGKGCTVRVLRPPLATETALGAAQIAFAAVAGLAGDSRAHVPDDAREYGRLAWSKERAGRTSFFVAHRYWRSAAAKKLTDAERVKHPAMKGWTVPTFYRWLRDFRARKRRNG